MRNTPRERSAPRVRAIARGVLLMAAAGALGACGDEVEQGAPPSAVSDSEILADTAKRDKVDREGIRPGG